MSEPTVRWPKTCPRCGRITLSVAHCCSSLLGALPSHLQPPTRFESLRSERILRAFENEIAAEVQARVTKTVTENQASGRVTEIVMTDGVRTRDSAG